VGLKADNQPATATCDVTVTAKEMPPIPGMVWIKPGTFTMGSPESEPDHATDETPHQVTLTGFYMGKYAVTQTQYEAVMGNNPSYFQTPVGFETSTANYPVERISWYDAIVFCNKLSMSEELTPAYRIGESNDPADWGIVPTSTNAAWNAVEIVAGSTGYRLPTEAEWEYACRAGTTTAFNTGNNITTDQANYDGNYPYNNNPKGKYRDRTTEVGSFAPNAYGLYDMHGNVWEWCWDWYNKDYYTDSPAQDPTGAVSSDARVYRGGSWFSVGHYLRSAYRYCYYPHYKSDIIGFRLVRPEALPHH
jgi:formylglycine-generating enzyme required for sulfatase activity